MSKLTDYVVFKDPRLARRYGDGRKMPIDYLYEAYFDGAVDVPGDIYGLMKNRHAVTEHKLITWHHFKYFFSKFVPEFVIHSKALDSKLVRWHYDRGDDFFAAFLGPRMVYTAAFFTQPGNTVEQAQDNKMDMVCQKLQLAPNDSFLDIGCGWGTLALHAAKYYGASSTGVTLSKNQTEFGNGRIVAAGLSEKARLLCHDYREIPPGRYKRIASLEMVEHVGIKNLVPFFRRVYDLLEDQGLFVLQWTGLRAHSSAEDLIWGLFMAKYIFPGADASLPPAQMIKAMQKGGLEVHSVENVSMHYVLTIKRWHDNWISNREKIVAAYGERWYRIWHWFLAWAVTIGPQGTAACYQILAHRNTTLFDRSIWVGKSLTLADRMKAPAREDRLPDYVHRPQPRA